MSLFRASGGNKFKIVNGSAKVRVATSKVLYFNGAVNSNWSTLGNWWQDEACTIPATHLPRSIDSVVATASIVATGQTVVDFTFNDPSFSSYSITGTLTVTGNATFNDRAINDGIVSGNATFNDNSYNYYGTIFGDATFNDGAINDGTVNGNATFNGGAYNFYGTIFGDATFNDGAINDGTVSGDATFNDSSFNDGTVSGDATFNGSSSTTEFGTVTGNATFNDSSFNNGTVDGTVTCNTTGTCTPI